MNKEVLRNRLRALLDIKGWTEETLEEKSGASQSTINRILNCTIDSPRISTLDKIAKALDVPLHMLTSNDISSEHKIAEPTLTYNKNNFNIDSQARTAVTLIEQGHQNKSLSNEDFLVINTLIRHLINSKK